MSEKNGSSILEQIITGNDLAALTGHSQRTIQRLAAQGIIKQARDQKGRKLSNRYRAGDACPRVCEYLRDQVLINDPDEASYRAARARKMAAEAAMSESALRLQRGELLDGEQVDREVMNVLSSVRSHMRALPSRISSLLLGLTRPQIHAVIKKYVDLALREASEFDLRQLVG